MTTQAFVRACMAASAFTVGTLAGVPGVFGVVGAASVASLASVADPAAAAGVAAAQEVTAEAPIPYDRLAARIVSALKVDSGERVLLRYDPQTLAPLEAVLRKALEAKGAKVDTLNYGPAPDLPARLDRTDIYVWLPAGPKAPQAPGEAEILARWLDEGKGRQVHFHWGSGTQNRDGLTGEHSAVFDRLYVDALDIDYAALSARQDRLIAQLRAGEIRVTTPAGTDLRFTVGDRPFNKQDGDASKARMQTAKVRVDREIELPAGVLRVAPIESSVHGTLVVPSVRFGSVTATGIRLEFKAGKVVSAKAESGDAALQAFLTSAPGASQFREFCLGVNPKLTIPAGSPYVPYYGYGDAVVRLSLGDNTEIGGAVRGGGTRWLFFPDTDVTVGGTPIVKIGHLVDRPK